MEYAGSRALFERCVAPLLRAAAPGTRLDDSTDTGLSPVSPPPATDGGEARAAEPEAPEAPTYTPAAPAQFNQFVGQVGPRADGPDQRAMAFAFYLWNYEKRDEFTAEDIEAFFRTVLDEPPEDLGGRLADLAERRRFLEAGITPACWRLTTKGVNYVKNRLLSPV